MHSLSPRQRRRSSWSTHLLVAAMAAAILLTLIPLGSGRIASAEQAQESLVNSNPVDLTTPEEDPTGIPDDLVVVTEDPTETPENPDELTDVPVEPTVTSTPPDDVTTADEEPVAPDLAVTKFVCPAGFDPSMVDLAAITATCTDVMVAHFEIFTHSDANTVAQETDYFQISTLALIGQTDIRETVPAGMLDPWVACYDMTSMLLISYDVAVGGFLPLQVASGQVIHCTFYNIPMPVEQEPTGAVEIKKWECPDGFIGGSWEEYLNACTMTMNGVPFHASSNGADLPAMMTGDSGDGSVLWTGLEAGPVVIQEEIPAGYGDPIVYCGFTGTIYNDAGAAALAHGYIFPDGVINGVLTHDLMTYGYLYCDWFNIPTGDNPGKITIFKHTCEAGYDVNAPGANPWLDCPDLTNGVLFTLYHGADVPLQTLTGDSIDGGVTWGGLMPGQYQVQETLPADTAYAFIFGCSSAIANAALAPTDLVAMEAGNTLEVDLLPGQDLVCHWYNVPNLHGGTVVITKYWCDGNVYAIHACDLYEQGATFTLGGYQVVTGWDGTVSIDLDAGAYELDEVGGAWCSAEASNVDQQGNIVVKDGKTTHVTVFNCGPRETPKGKPNPGKFPNTGIGLGPIASTELI